MFTRFVVSLLLALSPVPVPAQMLTLGVGQSTSTGCSQATALLARMDGSQNTVAVRTLVCGMVTDGTWQLMDFLYVFAINSTANANINWISTSFPLTQVGTVTLTANDGYTGNGTTGYFTNGYQPSTAAGNMTLNSGSIGACQYALSGADNSIPIGGNDASFRTVYYFPSTTGTGVTGFAMNDQNNGASTGASVAGSGIVSRTGSSAGAIALYSNGSSVGVVGEVSSALMAIPIFILAYNNIGTPVGWSNKKTGYVFGGGGLTSTQAANVYNRLHTYLSTVGATAGC